MRILFCFCFFLSSCNFSDLQENVRNQKNESLIDKGCLTENFGIDFEENKRYLILYSKNGCLGCTVSYLKDSCLLNAPEYKVMIVKEASSNLKMLRGIKFSENIIIIDKNSFTKDCFINMNSAPLLLQFQNSVWYYKSVREKLVNCNSI